MFGWYSNRQGIAGQPFALMYAYSQIISDGVHPVGQGFDPPGRSSPQTAFELALTRGTATQAVYTQGNFDYLNKPTVAQHSDAALHQITGHTSIFNSPDRAGGGTNLSETLRLHLSQGTPVAITIGMTLGLRAADSTSGPIDDITNRIDGNADGFEDTHEVLALGYDSNGLIIQNSWGTGWGESGFGHLSWRYVENEIYSADIISGLEPFDPTAQFVAFETVLDGSRVMEIAQNTGSRHLGARIVGESVNWGDLGGNFLKANVDPNLVTGFLEDGRRLVAAIGADRILRVKWWSGGSWNRDWHRPAGDLKLKLDSQSLTVQQRSDGGLNIYANRLSDSASAHQPGWHRYWGLVDHHRRVARTLKRRPAVGLCHPRRNSSRRSTPR